MKRCICVADHNLDGKPVQCLNFVPKGKRKCFNCKADYALLGTKHYAQRAAARGL